MKMINAVHKFLKTVKFLIKLKKQNKTSFKTLSVSTYLFQAILNRIQVPLQQNPLIRPFNRTVSLHIWKYLDK